MSLFKNLHGFDLVQIPLERVHFPPEFHDAFKTISLSMHFYKKTKGTYIFEDKFSAQP